MYITVIKRNRWQEGGSDDPNFFLNISSSRVEIRLHAEFQLPSMPGSGSSAELEASLAPAEAEVRAVAKVDTSQFE